MARTTDPATAAVLAVIETLRSRKRRIIDPAEVADLSWVSLDPSERTGEIPLVLKGCALKQLAHVARSALQRHKAIKFEGQLAFDLQDSYPIGDGEGYAPIEHLTLKVGKGNVLRLDASGKTQVKHSRELERFLRWKFGNAAYDNA